MLLNVEKTKRRPREERDRRLEQEERAKRKL
jgi:hypothetical protein